MPISQVEVFSQREPTYLFVTLIELQTPCFEHQSRGLTKLPRMWCDVVHLASDAFVCFHQTMTPPC